LYKYINHKASFMANITDDLQRWPMVKHKILHRSPVTALLQWLPWNCNITVH
jgi:hypothetical protein